MDNVCPACGGEGILQATITITNIIPIIIIIVTINTIITTNYHYCYWYDYYYYYCCWYDHYYYFY